MTDVTVHIERRDGNDEDAGWISDVPFDELVRLSDGDGAGDVAPGIAYVIASAIRGGEVSGDAIEETSDADGSDVVDHLYRWRIGDPADGGGDVVTRFRRLVAEIRGIDEGDDVSACARRLVGLAEDVEDCLSGDDAICLLGPNGDYEYDRRCVSDTVSELHDDVYGGGEEELSFQLLRVARKYFLMSLDSLIVGGIG